MVLFIIFFIFCFGLAISIMLNKKKSIKEVLIFGTLTMLGFVVWIALITENTIKPNRWIAWVIDLTGL